MRRSRFALFIILLSASSAFSKDIYFPIAGTTSTLGAFKTDVRIFNPSSSKDITVQVFLLPAGNRDNSAVSSQNKTVPKRQMLILNDVVAQFGGSDLNAIRLSSSDDFVATERVYAARSASGSCNTTGTVGQDIAGVDATAAKRNGVLLQLKTTTGDCTQAGVSSFRSNVGVINPGTNPAQVTFRLYDKNNVLITGDPITIPPMGVIAPTNIISGFFFSPGASDLTDAWVSFASDQPLFAYGSVIDNCTSDPTYIAMSEDATSTTTGTREFFFPTAGANAGATKSDLRLFNPSPSKDITVQASFLSVGNQDNTSASPHAITVPKRQMVVLNDFVTSFGGGNNAAIHLTSSDDFVATQRVFSTISPSASCNIAGTVGQDVAALKSSSAQKSGVLLQLKSGSGFQTQIGAVNPNGTAAKVTFRLYDKNNAVITTGSEITMPPMATIAPTNITSGFFFNAGNADLTDAWVSYTSDPAILAYASVVDTGTNDPTFFPVLADTGSPAQSTAKAFAFNTHGNGSASSFGITVTPAISDAVNVGDTLTITITTSDPLHGFELMDPDGVLLINIAALNVGQTVTRTVNITKEGTYNFFCTNPSCGVGHTNMFGQFVVGQGGDDRRPPY